MDGKTNDEQSWFKKKKIYLKDMLHIINFFD